MIEVLGIVSGLLAIVGVLLNNRKLTWCFPLWLASNAISCGLHLHGAMYSLAGRDAVFFVLALDGWRKWRNNDKGA